MASPNIWRAKASSTPWRSASVMSSSMARPSSWWNIGTCVASGRVGPVHAPGHHHVDRRLLELHRAHLHRRGVGAQQHALGQVEGVLGQPRRVLGRMVERGEVVVVELDLGALEHREAEPHEDVLHPAPDLRDQVEVAHRERRVAGERHVDAVLGEPALKLRRAQLRVPGLDQPLERPAHLVGPLAHRARAPRAAARRSSGAAG